MAKTVTLLRGTTGLNNRLDPARLPSDPETGVQDLAVALNVDIDDTGQVSRRGGYSLLRTGNFHSLFCDGGECLVFSKTAKSLYRVNPDFTLTGIRSGMTPEARISYAQAHNGKQDEIYYANGFENGVVRDGVSYVWQAATYVGPSTVRTFSDPPIGHLLALYAGRMYVAQDKVLWYSEPFAFSYFDLARNYIPFSSRIRMAKGGHDGLWVSDSKAAYYLAGTSTKEFTSLQVADYPAIEGTAVVVDGAWIGQGQITGRVVLWASTKGICAGFPQGEFRNLTEDRLIYPEASTGSGLVINNQYLCLLDS